jgi:biopolymer transport protein ExbB
MPFLPLQSLTMTPDSVATSTQQAAAESISYAELLIKGGWVIYPIAFLLLMSVYFIVERILFINRSAQINLTLINQLKNAVLSGDLKSAVTFCRSSDIALARILEKGVIRVGKPIKDIESAMETQSGIEIAQMEKNLGFLGLIASIAPILGFIGTISGVIRIFYDISVSQDISINVISSGLYEKMISSFAGLIVGVIAYSGYHLLNMRIDKFTLHLQSAAMEFLDTLNAPLR